MPQPLKVLIVDDEAPARELTRIYLTDYCVGVDIVGEVGTVADAVKMIQLHKPNLVLLDIEMPGGSGFDLFEYFDTPDFQVIFITAYEEYALKAIRLSALDYLLKPLKIKDLVKSIEKSKQQFEKEMQFKKLESLLYNLNENSLSKISIPTGKGIIFAKLEEISVFEADGPYTNIYFVDERKIIVSKTLKEVISVVPEDLFFKPHRSYSINLKHVKEYVKEQGGQIVMNSGKVIPISRLKRDDFITAIKAL